MYCAVVLPEIDHDLHRFVWRSNPSDHLQYFRMTRVSFGVSSSSFAANMAVKRNSLDLASKYPLAAQVVSDSFYVDDGLAGADSVQEESICKLNYRVCSPKVISYYPNGMLLIQLSYSTSLLTC